MAKKSEKSEKKEVSKDTTDKVFVGKKPTDKYVLAVLTMARNRDEVTIEARGNMTSRAIDVALASERFSGGELQIQDIELGTDMVENDGKPLAISTIDIVLKKKA